MPKPSQKCTILIIHLTAIGDIVISSPVATALKRQNPSAAIVWITQKKYALLLDSHPDVDEVITVDIETWQLLWKYKKLISLYRHLTSLRRKLGERNYDKAIDLQGNFLTGLISTLSGAQHRIALGASGNNSWFTTKTISRNMGDETQIGAEYRYLANQLGASDANWTMHAPAKTEKKAPQTIPGGIEDAPYAVICPFASEPQKNWFDDYWEQIVLRLRGRYQMRTIILGGPRGKEKAEKIARLCGATNFAGKASLEEAMALVSQAKLMVGVDTGLTHLAHAYRIPTICLFGATYPYAYVDNEVSRIIYLDRFCSPCRQNPTCRGKYQCMREITPDKVLTAIKPLLKNSLTQQ